MVLIIIPRSTILFINGDNILEWYSSWTDIVIVVYSYSNDHHLWDFYGIAQWSF